MLIYLWIGTLHVSETFSVKRVKSPFCQLNGTLDGTQSNSAENTSRALAGIPNKIPWTFYM